MKRFLPIIALVALLSSCSPYQLVNSEVYNNADLASYKTFRIVTPEEGKLPPGMEMVTYYNIAAAIREQMVERGYTESPTSPLLINIAVTTQREISTEPALPPGYMPYNGPYYPYWMYPRYNYWTNYCANAQVITGIYKEGVLTMDMVNINEKVPLYSSSVATIINNGGSGPSQYRNLEAIAQAVEVLFSKYPVPLMPQYRK
ncbi:MAG: DUF4136 domain-containing protein [Muribaculaceae bacterium]|nr:DUF4136 domain-containing protein [Muribaculaceae bacterium]MDE6322127.1 DUF4136 domain-containing protein [Muribaculaceae bacterium]